MITLTGDNSHELEPDSFSDFTRNRYLWGRLLGKHLQIKTHLHGEGSACRASSLVNRHDTAANENGRAGRCTNCHEKTKFAEREELGSVIRVVIHTLLPTGTV